MPAFLAAEGESIAVEVVGADIAACTGPRLFAIRRGRALPVARPSGPANAP